MASKSPWGTVGWWIIVALSIPFSLYAAVFVIGNFDVYRTMTTTWLEGKHDIAGLHILHHIRAWQIHAAAAELFIGTGPFQLSPSFRKKYPTLHRWMGYVFVWAGLVCAASALSVMIPNTEFGPLAQLVFASQGIMLIYFLVVAVRTARARKFLVHQRYMIRAAAAGYAVMVMRPFVAILNVLGMPVPLAMEVSALAAVLLLSGSAELYIRRVLLTPKGKTDSKGGNYGMFKFPLQGKKIGTTD